MDGKMRDLGYLTDENLVEMFKAGNEWCFNEIYNRYYNRLYGYAVKYLLSKEDAEEVVNATLFKAFKYLHKFRGEASLATWLFQILRNQTFNLYRIKRSRGVFVTQSLEVITSDNSPFIMEIIDCKSIPEKTLMNQEITDCIMAAIDDLPEAMKETATLYLIEKLPLNKIAKELDCSMGTIRSRTFRIRKHIKKLLTDLEK